MKTGTRMPVATLFMISARLSRRVERWARLHPWDRRLLGSKKEHVPGHTHRDSQHRSC